MGDKTQPAKDVDDLGGSHFGSLDGQAYRYADLSWWDEMDASQPQNRAQRRKAERAALKARKRRGGRRG